MKASALFLFLVCLQRVSCSLPDFTPTSIRLQRGQVEASNVNKSLKKENGLSPLPGLNRLPGLCRRLKRRRVTILCNRERFCWRGRGQKSAQVCLCPRGSRCSHFFIHSL